MRARPWLVGALVAVLAASGCAAGGQGSDGGFVGGDGSYTRVAPAERQAAPVLAGHDLDGKPLSTNDYRDRVVVLNVWGSWCAPCRKEAPDLVEAAHRTQDKAQFIGLDTRDLDAAPAQAFVRAFSVPYPTLYDPDGSLLLQLGGQVPPNAIPTTLILDRQGRVAARIMGATTTSTITGLVDDIAEGR